MVVTIRPNIDIDTIIPIVIVKPSKINVDFFDFSETCDAKYERKPGYNGRTHTAVKGAASPMIKKRRRLTLITSLLSSSISWHIQEEQLRAGRSIISHRSSG